MTAIARKARYARANSRSRKRFRSALLTETLEARRMLDASRSLPWVDQSGFVDSANSVNAFSVHELHFTSDQAQRVSLDYGDRNNIRESGLSNAGIYFEYPRQSIRAFESNSTGELTVASSNPEVFQEQPTLAPNGDLIFRPSGKPGFRSMSEVVILRNGQFEKIVQITVENGGESKADQPSDNLSGFTSIFAEGEHGGSESHGSSSGSSSSNDSSRPCLNQWEEITFDHGFSRSAERCGPIDKSIRHTRQDRLAAHSDSTAWVYQGMKPGDYALIGTAIPIAQIIEEWSLAVPSEVTFMEDVTVSPSLEPYIEIRSAFGPWQANSFQAAIDWATSAMYLRVKQTLTQPIGPQDAFIRRRIELSGKQDVHDTQNRFTWGFATEATTAIESAKEQAPASPGLTHVITTVTEPQYRIEYRGITPFFETTLGEGHTLQHLSLEKVNLLSNVNAGTFGIGFADLKSIEFTTPGADGIKALRWNEDQHYVKKGSPYYYYGRSYELRDGFLYPSEQYHQQSYDTYILADETVQPGVYYGIAHIELQTQGFKVDQAGIRPTEVLDFAAAKNTSVFDRSFYSSGWHGQTEVGAYSRYCREAVSGAQRFEPSRDQTIAYFENKNGRDTAWEHENCDDPQKFYYTIQVAQPIAVVIGNVAPTSHAPVIVSEPTLIAERGRNYRYSVLGADVDGDPLLYSIVSGLPNMTIDGQTGVFSWAPQAIGKQTIVVKATDPSGLFGLQTFTVTVSGTNQPPLFDSVPVTELTPGKGYEYLVKATDPDGDAIHFEMAMKLGWTLQDHGDGTSTLAYTPNALESNKLWNISLKAIDEVGNIATQNFTVNAIAETHANLPPVISSTPKIRFEKAGEGLVPVGDVRDAQTNKKEIQLAKPRNRLDLQQTRFTHSLAGSLFDCRAGSLFD